MEFFTVIFLILVGAVFVAGPANLLLSIFPSVPYWIWAVIISTCAVELRLRRQYSSHADTCLPLGSKIDPLI